MLGGGNADMKNQDRKYEGNGADQCSAELIVHRAETRSTNAVLRDHSHSKKHRQPNLALAKIITRRLIPSQLRVTSTVNISA
jgi:hypothetical protein